MELGPDLALLAVALSGVVFLLVIWVALRNWVFELSPNEWLYSLVFSFALGVFVASYLDGDAILLLLSILALFVAFVWWVFRLFRRHSAKNQMRAAKES
ncbi:MAG: hypothetical protein ACREC5_08615 [Thermoplasmata archaeon]